MRPAFHRGALFTAPVVAVEMATAHNRKAKTCEDEADAAERATTGVYLRTASACVQTVRCALFDDDDTCCSSRRMLGA